MQPTLFQQFMGEPAPQSFLVGLTAIPVPSGRLGGDDESEEEEDDEKSKGKSKVEKLSDGKQQKACPMPSVLWSASLHHANPQQADSDNEDDKKAMQKTPSFQLVCTMVPKLAGGG